MQVWICIEDMPKIAFVISPAPSNPKILVGFYLICPVGYVKSVPLFCATMEIIANMANHDTKITAPDPIDTLMDSQLPPDNPAAFGVLTATQEQCLAFHFNALLPAWQQ